MWRRASVSPKPVILDVDPGHDDAVALMLACGHPDLDLLAVAQGDALAAVATHHVRGKIVATVP